MRKLFIICALYSFVCIQNTFSQDCDYAEYYHLTDLARKSYTIKDYKEARNYFQLAFDKADFPHGQDLNFALFTAVKLKDDSWAAQIAEKLAKGGIPLRYFMRFNRLKWFPEFESNFQNYVEYYENNFDLGLQLKLKLLLTKDIDTNDRYHKWRTREIDMTLDELIYEATEILSDFEKIVNLYGFPNESQMGYNYIRRKNSVEPYNIELLMVHIYGRGVYFLKEKITNIVCEGGLPPYYDEMLKSISKGDSPGVEEEMKAKYTKFRGGE